jgi:hypothetical protein
MSDFGDYAFAIVQMPPPGTDRDAILRHAIVVGEDKEVFEYIGQSTARGEAAQRLADQQARVVQDLEAVGRAMDAGARLMDMTEAMTVREDKQRKRDAKHRADQERRAQEAAARAEAAELRGWLVEHPEPGASTDETNEPEPGGELHVRPPPDTERYGAGDDQGALPNELEEGAPPSSGTYVEPDPEDLGGPKNPRSVPQPASTSLW